MTSWKKVLSNRANAQKSTGPRTAAGKAASRLNSLRHGLFARLDALPQHDQAEFRMLLAELERDWEPVGFQEQQLVEAIALGVLQQRRGLEVEFQLYAAGARTCRPGETLKLAVAFENASAMIERSGRQTTTAERRVLRAIDRLAKLQEARARHEARGDSDTPDVDAVDVGANALEDEGEPSVDDTGGLLFGLMTDVGAEENLKIETGAAGVTVADVAFAETNPPPVDGAGRAPEGVM